MRVAAAAVLACACGATATTDDDAARADARPRDAHGADATAREDVTLYALIGPVLVELDPETGASRRIGDSQDDGRMVWDRDAGVMRVIRSALANPTLGTLDRCTGDVTGGPAINDSGHRAPVVEGITQAEDGRLFIAVDTTDPVMGTTSDTLATFDVATAQATRIGPLHTTQDDGDAIEFAGARLYAMDLIAGTATELYEVDADTAEVTRVATLSDGLRELAYDPARDAVFSFDRPRRQLVRVDPDTGQVTDVGDPSYVAGEFGDDALGSLVSAPRAACP